MRSTLRLFCLALCCAAFCLCQTPDQSDKPKAPAKLPLNPERGLSERGRSSRLELRERDRILGRIVPLAEGLHVSS